ncbi:hypothetical protein NLJ89_g12285 [Agrocybe chaxingu]|uniref:Uncharacterized protein n=1 Tax=Agrocybe chaxingu TaxID=84603 RepID=A0A9W8JNE5_9AGAR|nr:hypothetical protein NLJ89_g12285 [Agrocybe chaxingu]
MLSRLEVLCLPSSIQVHVAAIEKLAEGRLLPSLTELEFFAANVEVILRVMERCKFLQLQHGASGMRSRVSVRDFTSAGVGRGASGRVDLLDKGYIWAIDLGRTCFLPSSFVSYSLTRSSDLFVAMSVASGVLVVSNNNALGAAVTQSLSSSIKPSNEQISSEG